MKRFLSTPDFCIDLPLREMLAQKTQSEKSGKTNGKSKYLKLFTRPALL